MSTLALTARADRAGRFLPLIAIAVFGIVNGAVLLASSAAGTLGYDFLAYHQAAGRVLDGQPLYDTSIQASGGFGLYYYPPPFILPVLPLGLLDATLATWTWIVLSVAAFAAGVALLPVSSTVRWLVVLLAGLSWPFAYALKLGQVGPILFLLLAAGWRHLDRPARLGSVAALGTMTKVQPGLLFAWALLTGRWRAVMLGVAALVTVSLATTVVTGASAWSDFLVLLRQVSDPIATPHNFTPGAVAYQLGVAADVAAIVQAATIVAVLVVVLAAVRLATAEASYLVTVVASQLVSPILWDHYAMLLLLPVAYLLERGRWWAALIPLATSIVVLPITPAITYPVVFAVALLAPLWVGRRSLVVHRPAA